MYYTLQNLLQTPLYKYFTPHMTYLMTYCWHLMACAPIASMVNNTSYYTELCTYISCTCIWVIIPLWLKSIFFYTDRGNKGWNVHSKMFYSTPTSLAYYMPIWSVRWAVLCLRASRGYSECLKLPNLAVYWWTTGSEVPGRQNLCYFWRSDTLSSFYSGESCWQDNPWIGWHCWQRSAAIAI